MEPIIKLLILDVDGTLTDGQIYTGEQGELFKAFNVKDGFAINQILPAAHILPVILTGRQSTIVENRMRELNVKSIYQGVSDKVAMLRVIAAESHVNLEECAYIGDDLNDLNAMKLCGFKACPHDAVREIKSICDYVSPFCAGQGAVRDICESILKKNGQWEIFLKQYLR